MGHNAAMRVLITGCSTGIGRATAAELTARGHEVIATARRPETLADLDVVQRLRLDVDDDASVREAVREAGRIDVLVNNAAWEVAGPLELIPLDRTKAMFETNVFGCLRLIQAAVPQMRERGSGTIVNVSSTVGRFAIPLSGAYSATKFALESLSEALHYELEHFGVRVIIVEPGGTATAWTSNEEWHGVAEGPYAELFQAMLGDRSDEGLTEAGKVATTIADAIESDEHRLRWPTTARVAAMMNARKAMDDEAFERAMWGVVGAEW